MVIFWACAIVVFLIVEAATFGLASIWFAIGSAAALVSALFDAPLWLQIVWFVLVSAVTLWLTRPLAAKYINGKSQATNADRVLGMEGYVTEAIDNIAAKGTVSVGGKLWSARSDAGGTIEKGALVKVLRIEGVKLYVIPAVPAQQEAVCAAERE